MRGRSSSKWHRYLRFWRADVAADVDDEITFHVDARTQELCDAGLDPAAARRQALREFGDIDRARQTLRDMDERHAALARHAHLATDLVRDVRVAIRALARSPGLVATVAVTLALGIGLTSTMYGVVDAYLFRPLPGVHGAELVALGRTEKDLPQPHVLTYPDFLDYRADTATFETLVAYSSRIVELETDRGTDRLWLDEGTANYFSALGLNALLGRTFVAGDDEGVVSHPAIVLTYKGWKAHFGGDSAIVGRVVRINDHPVTVIGIMPADFHGVLPLVDIDGVACINQVWPTDVQVFRDRGALSVNVFGRLRAGISIDDARKAVRLDGARLEQAYPATNKNVGVVLVRERYARPSIAVASVTSPLAAMFMSLVMLVLLVACANVASLLLARVVVRSRELAIRAAIGASQWRLARHVVIECVLLAVLGGAGAIAVTFAALHAVESIHLATDLPVRWGVEMNARVVAFIAFATLIAAIATGVGPVMATRKRRLHDLLKSGTGNSPSMGHQRLRSALVVGQIAVSVVVLACAGLFVRSAAYASHMQLGFRSDHVLMLSVALPRQSYDSTRGRALYREMLRRAATVPGVRSASLTRYLPFGFERDNATVFPIASSVVVPPNGFSYFTDIVAGEYFATMGVPLLAGRPFHDDDDASSPQVAIVNDALAKALWPGQPAVGKRFHAGAVNGPIVEVVGVVRGMQDLFPGEIPKPYVFRPLAQAYAEQMTLLVHSTSETSALAAPLRATIAGLDPRLPVFDVRTMDDHLRNGQAFLFSRIGSAFASVFGLLALVLATVGVYGVVSYSVAQRTREIGVRVALGARRTTILRLVVGQGLRLASVGIGAGLLLSLAATGLVASALYGVGPRDPPVLLVVAATLALVAAFASLVPARRAMRIDPLTSLRSE
jgi:putative ABC transport system permease protein